MSRKRIALLLLFTAVVMTVQVGMALANGRVVRFDRQMAGPYEIAMGTIPDSPTVGNLHLTFTLADAETKEYIVDARVTVEGKQMIGDGTDTGLVEAVKNRTDPIYYDVNTFVDREGGWVFTVAVDALLGEAQTEFRVEVRNLSPVTGMATLLTLLAFLVVLGLSLRAYLSERVGKSRRR